MFVLERESGDVIAMSTAGIETRISVVVTRNGRFILAIDAPPDTQLLSVNPQNGDEDQEQELRNNYRQELLMF